MAGLWSLLATACAATASLSRVPPLDDNPSLTAASHELVRHDLVPVRLIRLGRRVLVPVQDLLTLLGGAA